MMSPVQRLKNMETINNKTLEKLKYELVRDGVVTYETLEKAEELANVQNLMFKYYQIISFFANINLLFNLKL